MIEPDKIRELRDFLFGAGPLDGYWFGEKHPNKTGQFWWRHHMRDLLDAILRDHSGDPTPTEARGSRSTSSEPDAAMWREGIFDFLKTHWPAPNRVPMAAYQIADWIEQRANELMRQKK